MLSPYSAARVALSGREKISLDDPIEIRKLLYRCEAIEELTGGRVRIAQIPIPRALRALDVTAGMRLVSIRLRDHSAAKLVDLNCAIPRDADPYDVLHSLQYEDVVARLQDPSKRKTFTESEIKDHIQRVVGVLRAEADMLRLPRRGTLASSDVVAIGLSAYSSLCDTTASGICIGGFTTTADPADGIGVGAGGGGAGGGGPDGYAGRTDPSILPTVDDPAGCINNCVPAPPLPCDPQIDPTCNQPLTKADSLLIQRAESLFKDPATIADSATRVQCDSALQWYNESKSGNMWFRGKYDTGHAGANYGGKLHMDPSMLADAANSASGLLELAKTLLHEATHYPGLHFHPADSLPPYAHSPFFDHIENFNKGLSYTN